MAWSDRLRGPGDLSVGVTLKQTHKTWFCHNIRYRLRDRILVQRQEPVKLVSSKCWSRNLDLAIIYRCVLVVGHFKGPPLL